VDVGHVEPEEGVHHVANALLKPPSVLSKESDALIKDILNNNNKDITKTNENIKTKKNLLNRNESRGTSHFLN
jgi:hypothetical protein